MGETRLARRRSPAAPISEATYAEIERGLKLATPHRWLRAESERFVREVAEYVEADRLHDAAAAAEARTLHRRRLAAVERAVTQLLEALPVLAVVPWTRGLDRLVLDRREFKMATACRAAVRRFRQAWTSYFVGLRGRASALRTAAARRGPTSGWLRVGIYRQLTWIIEDERCCGPGKATLHRKGGDEPSGRLFTMAAALRPYVPCLPTGDEALFGALQRARAVVRALERGHVLRATRKQKQRKTRKKKQRGQVLSARRKNSSS